MITQPNLIPLSLEPGARLVDIYLGVPIVYYSFRYFPRVKREYHWTLFGVLVESKNLKSARSAIAKRMKDLGVTRAGVGEPLTHRRVRVTSTQKPKPLGDRLESSKKIFSKYAPRTSYLARENGAAGRIPKVRPS